MMLDLLAAIRLADGSQIDDEAYRAAFDRLDRHMLGMLLRKCRDAKQITMPENDESVLQDALAKRNYLMHQFFSVHDAELVGDDQLLVNELRELAATLAAARQTAEALYLAILGTLDSDGKMAERILRLGTAWQNVVVK